ncbi:hypothetical protein FPV67DRAFT_1417237 [Lyophyllum atratum]|nr:hypothetical protein FPV67DRAFT_1417237 [Lyophyllum atratum]
MEEIRGVSLDKVVDNLSKEQQLHIALQLSAILGQMRTFQSKTLGSITGGSYRNVMAVPQPLQPKHAFATMSEFRDYFRDLLVKCRRFEWQIEKIMSCIPLNCPIRFTHGDLVPKNIMVDGSTVTGVIDWANAGFYPEFWEYARMNDPNFMSPGWSNILQIVFPGEHRIQEIDAVAEIMTTIDWWL